MLMLSSGCRGRAERGILTYGPACDAHHSLPGLATLGHQHRAQRGTNHGQLDKNGAAVQPTGGD